jgi:hypothetical protein
VLTPTGNGSFAHIGEEVDVPGPIDLKEGLFEVRGVGSGRAGAGWLAGLGRLGAMDTKH